MNPLGMDNRDQAEFERLSCLNTSSDSTVLRKRLGDNVWTDNRGALPDEVVKFVQSINTSYLVTAGRHELAWWSKTLPRRTRNKMQRFFPGTVAMEKTASVLRLDGYSKASLEHSMRMFFHENIDVLLRAGLHHLARCLADCNPRLLRNSLYGLEPSWSRYLMLFHVALSEHTSCRQRAANMRRYWTRWRKK